MHKEAGTDEYSKIPFVGSSLTNCFDLIVPTHIKDNFNSLARSRESDIGLVIKCLQVDNKSELMSNLTCKITTGSIFSLTQNSKPVHWGFIVDCDESIGISRGFAVATIPTPGAPLHVLTVDHTVEEFSKKFNQRLKLQRYESISHVNLGLKLVAKASSPTQ